jgi:hypothetical protein
MFLLRAVVLVTSLQNPTPHVGDRFWMTFESQYTCEAAQHQLLRNAEFIGKLVENRLKNHTTSRELKTECVRVSARI